MSILKQAVGLYEEGLSVRQVAAALRISKSEAERLRLRARGAGLVVSSDNTAATEANISNGKRVHELLGVKSRDHMKRQRFAIVDRLQNLAAAATMCFVLCGPLLAGPAKAAFNGAFKTSSGNIVCDLSDTDVVCVIKSGLEPAPPKIAVCNGGDPVSDRVDLSGTGIAEPVPCAGDPGPLADDADAKVLGYGSTMVRAKIGCVAFEFGLACVNSKGHGFFLSRASARYF